MYIPGPPQLEAAHRPNLALTFDELIQQKKISGNPKETFELTDKTVPSLVEIFILLREEMQTD